MPGHFFYAKHYPFGSHICNEDGTELCIIKAFRSRLARDAWVSRGQTTPWVPAYRCAVLSAELRPHQRCEAVAAIHPTEEG